MTQSTLEAEPRQESTPEPKKEVPRWAIHRRLYDWVLSWAHSPHSDKALFGLAFAESSVFPIPPDVLQIALSLERRERAWVYGFITLIGSVLGAILGYMIGAWFWSAAEGFFIPTIFSQAAYDKVWTIYNEWDILIVFVAAFTPIPFKIITITAGVFGLNFPLFVLACIVGRGARFFLVAGLLYYCGPPVKRFIDKYFNLVCLLFTVLLIGGFVLIKYVVAH